MPGPDPGIRNGGPGAKADRPRPAAHPVSTEPGRALPALGDAADGTGGGVGTQSAGLPGLPGNG